MSLMRHWVCGLGHSFSRDPGATCPREDRLSHEPCGAPVFEWVDAATYQGAVGALERIAAIEVETPLLHSSEAARLRNAVAIAAAALDALRGR